MPKTQRCGVPKAWPAATGFGACSVEGNPMKDLTGRRHHSGPQHPVQRGDCNGRPGASRGRQHTLRVVGPRWTQGVPCEGDVGTRRGCGPGGQDGQWEETCGEILESHVQRPVLGCWGATGDDGQGCPCPLQCWHRDMVPTPHVAPELLPPQRGDGQGCLSWASVAASPRSLTCSRPLSSFERGQTNPLA